MTSSLRQLVAMTTHDSTYGALSMEKRCLVINIFSGDATKTFKFTVIFVAQSPVFLPPSSTAYAVQTAFWFTNYKIHIMSRRLLYLGSDRI